MLDCSCTVLCNPGIWVRPLRKSPVSTQLHRSLAIQPVNNRAFNAAQKAFSESSICRLKRKRRADKWLKMRRVCFTVFGQIYSSQSE